MLLPSILMVTLAGFLTEINCQKEGKALPAASAPDDTYNVLQSDGSYEFGYANRDRGASYHFADANSRNVVRGKFGSRNPGTGRIDETIYTAGPRGFRPRGPNIHRKYNLNQNGPRPIGNRDDPLFDPSEDPSYSFGFRTRTYNRDETANRNADVTGRYSFLDDVGERHDVEYIAGKNTGFHVKTAYPDSNPRPYGPLRYAGKRPRGHTSIQRGLDGSYRFVSGGPDQRRTETSDSAGNVRGSYSFLDDKGKQHAVHYIAGPNIGYRVLKNSKDYPNLFPYGPRPSPPYRPNLDSFGDNLTPSALDDFIFSGASGAGENLNTAASGHVKPKPNPSTTTPNSKPSLGQINKEEDDDGSLDNFYGNKPNKVSTDNSFIGGGPSGGGDDDDEDDADIFGEGNTSGNKRPSTTARPVSSTAFPSSSPIPTTSKPQNFLTETPRPISVGGSGSTGPSSSENTGFGNTGSGGNFGNTGTGTGNTGGGYPSAGSGFDGPDDSRDTTFNIYPSGTDSWNSGLGSTILRNLGTKSVHLPPGVSVRAHVQAIDILPYGSRLPSPSAQLEKDSKS